MSQVKTEFAAAESALKQIAALRARLAGLIGAPGAKLEEIAAARQEAEDLMASAGTHEEGLRQIERALIVANDEAGLAKREAKLKDFALSRERLSVLIEEIAKLEQATQQALDNEAARQWAIPRVAEFHKMVAAIDETKALAEKLGQLAELAKDAGHLGLQISGKRDLFPGVDELDIRWPLTLRDPEKAIEQLALRHTELVRPRR